MRRLLLVLAVAAAMAVTAVVPAVATPPTGTEITNKIDDVEGSEATYFTTTGGVVCSGGMVSNVFFKASGGGPTGVNFQVVKKFSCNEGDFYVKLQVRLSFDTFTTTFNWNVVGGTGDYEGLHGSGAGFSTQCGGNCIIDHYSGGLHIDP